MYSAERNIDLLPVTEMRKAEWSRFRDDWIDQYATEEAVECGVPRDVKVAEIRFEDYCGQEGWTRRDMDIVERRDAILRAYPKDRLELARPHRVVVTEEGEYVFVEHYGMGDVHYGLFRPDGTFHRYVARPAEFLKAYVNDEAALPFVGRVPGDWGYEEFWTRQNTILNNFPKNPAWRAHRVIRDVSRGELVLVEGLNLPDDRAWGLFTPAGVYVRHCDPEGK